MFGRYSNASSSSGPVWSRGQILLLATFICFAVACGTDENSNTWEINDRDAKSDAECFEDAVDEDSSSEDAGAPDATPTVNLIPVSVETVLAPTSAAAGSTVTVDCQLLNSDGERVAVPEDAEPRLVYAPVQSFLPSTSLELIPIVVGQ